MSISRTLGMAIVLALAVAAPPLIAATNVAPVITGTPATSVAAGTRYTFRPSATDANGDWIRFSISGMPSWGTFQRRTGEFTGIPPAGVNATFSNIVISASDGRLRASLPPFSIQVTSATANAAPTIAGSPATSVLASAAYSFKPTAADANGDPLSFSIVNKPSWATFGISTGQLSGTAPSIASTTAGIVISVSDGQVSTALPAFSINVVAAAMGTASLSWSAPTQNTDGSALTTLAGFHVYFGSSPTAMTQAATISSPGTTAYVMNNLGTGTWYFALTAYTSTGQESARSAIVSKSIS